MKIFIVSNSLGGGGAERVGVNLANGFAQHGHLTYLVTDVNQPAHYLLDKKVQTLPLCNREDGKGEKWIRSIIRIRKYAQKERPNIIIGITNLPSIVAKIGVAGMGIPVILTIHHAIERIKSQPLSRRTLFYDKYISKIYKYVAVLSQADKEYLHNRKGIFVMPNPVSFEPLTALPPKDKIVIVAGRLSDWHIKGWDVLIKAWKSLQKSNDNVNDNFKDWWLKIAGTGTLENFDYLKSLIPNANWIKTENGWKSDLFHIEFLGYRTDMEQLFLKASIFVLSSRSEGLPMVLIEAMSQGCAPVATSNLGRTKDIITSNKEGLICPPEDFEGLAKCIEKLIQDNLLRKEIQQNAIERSKYYALDNIIKMWEDLFKTIS
jgi:glycosyltransferase involved in cell wall biosynthesis